ncbi:hypothetical protein [Amycolatopsis sp. NPDC004079]|uniref:hypothetical protein n=1 Tax=Amycolatopsis sp. NPDC004079 TaxID=3154549 RepID=UPI0033B0DAA6
MTTDLAAEHGGIRDGRRAEDAGAHAGNGRANSDDTDVRDTALLKGDGVGVRDTAMSDGGCADGDGMDARGIALLNGDGAGVRGGAALDGGRADGDGADASDTGMLNGAGVRDGAALDGGRADGDGMDARDTALLKGGGVGVRGGVISDDGRAIEDCPGAGSAAEKRAAAMSREDNAAQGYAAEVIHDSTAAEDLAPGENAVMHDSASANGAEAGGAAVEDLSATGRGEELRETVGSRAAARRAAAVMRDSASATSIEASRAAAVIHETAEQDSMTGAAEASAATERAEPSAETERAEPSAATGRAEPSAKPKPRGRWWRGFTGSVAAGMAVLAVGVLVVGVLCLVNGASGPGALKLVGHPVAAVIVLALQRIADRRAGKVAALAGAGVLVVAGVAFGVLWWF